MRPKLRFIIKKELFVNVPIGATHSKESLSEPIPPSSLMMMLEPNGYLIVCEITSQEDDVDATSFLVCLGSCSWFYKLLSTIILSTM